MRFLQFPIVVLFIATAHADTFGIGTNMFTMDFVSIGNAGNADDDTSYGGVGYSYRMGVNEVSRGMIGNYNALGGGPMLTMDDMTPYGGNGVNRPATGVSWNEAARFVNWLNTSKGYTAAYKFTTGGFNDNIALWTSGDAGYDASNPFRNANAYYFLPSEDEWYKAAYYDPNKGGVGVGGYWDYATGSDTPPTEVASGTTSGTVVSGQASDAGPADITLAGGLSRYGTMAQNGNVWEWGESGDTIPNDAVNEFRMIRGGAWYNTPGIYKSSLRIFGQAPTVGLNTEGFRVASVPEPSGVLLTMMGIMGVALRRRR